MYDLPLRWMHESSHTGGCVHVSASLVGVCIAIAATGWVQGGGRGWEELRAARAHGAARG